MRSGLVASKAGGSSEAQSGTAAPATTGSEWVGLSLAAVWKLLSWHGRVLHNAPFSSNRTNASHSKQFFLLHAHCTCCPHSASEIR